MAGREKYGIWEQMSMRNQKISLPFFGQQELIKVA